MIFNIFGAIIYDLKTLLNTNLLIEINILDLDLRALYLSDFSMDISLKYFYIEAL